MWTYRTDLEAYHAHRRLIDPTLPPRRGDRAGRERPWFRVLDAGVRQCRAMEEQAGEEAVLLYSLLNTATMLSGIRSRSRGRS